ncbi:MAG: DAK2 domain fusion protein YloV, partial [Actinomycetota bacterium]|nr:DAK2 domain fusion protein YloV [Actinomycetota bacterium]
LLLPNDGDTVLAAAAAAEVAADEGITVRVVPQARAAVQGLAALAVWSPEAGLDDNAAVMGAAAEATRRGAVTVANRDGDTPAGPCRVGDVLGLVDGEVSLVGHDLPTVATAVVTQLLDRGGELVTLIAGEQAPAGLSETVEAAALLACPGVEVTRVYGGQPVFALFVGVE